MGTLVPGLMRRERERLVHTARIALPAPVAHSVPPPFKKAGDRDSQTTPALATHAKEIPSLVPVAAGPDGSDAMGE